MFYFLLPGMTRLRKRLLMLILIGILFANAYITEAKEVSKKYKKGYVIEVQSHNQAVKSANPIVDLEQSISEGISDPFADPKFIINKINEEFFGTELRNTMQAGSPALETRLHSKELLAFRGLTNPANSNGVVRVGGQNLMPSLPVQQHAIKEHHVAIQPQMSLAELRLRQQLLNQRFFNSIPQRKRLQESVLASQLSSLNLAGLAQQKPVPLGVQSPDISRASLAPDLNSGLTNPALSNSLNPVTSPDLLPGLQKVETPTIDPGLLTKSNPSVLNTQPSTDASLLRQKLGAKVRSSPLHQINRPSQQLQRQTHVKTVDKLLTTAAAAPKLKETSELSSEEGIEIESLGGDIGQTGGKANIISESTLPHGIRGSSFTHGLGSSRFSHPLDASSLARSYESAPLSSNFDSSPLQRSYESPSLEKSLGGAELNDGLKLDSALDANVGSSSVAGASTNSGTSPSSQDPLSGKDIEDNYSSIKDFLDADNILRQKFKDGVDISPPAKTDNSPLADLLHKKHHVPRQEVDRLFRRVLLGKKPNLSAGKKSSMDNKSSDSGRAKKISWHDTAP